MDDATDPTASRPGAPGGAGRRAGGDTASRDGRAAVGAAGGTAASPGDGTVRRRPTTAEAFRAQLALVFRRRWSLAGLAVVTGLALTVVAASAAGAGPVGLSELAHETWTLPGALAAFWPMMAAWRDDTPSERAYHWTLPVDRSRLQLLRVAAGWVHLVTGLAAGLALGWATGASIHDGMAAGRLEVLAAVVPSATVLYLVGTLFALSTDRPALWLFLAYLSVAAVEALAMARGWTWLRTLVGEVFTSGPLSLTAAGVLPQAVSGELGGSTVADAPWRAAGLWLVVTAGLTVATAGLHLEGSGEG